MPQALPAAQARFRGKHPSLLRPVLKESLRAVKVEPFRRWVVLCAVTCLLGIRLHSGANASQRGAGEEPPCAVASRVRQLRQRSSCESIAPCRLTATEASLRSLFRVFALSCLRDWMRCRQDAAAPAPANNALTYGGPVLILVSVTPCSQTRGKQHGLRDQGIPQV